MSENGRRQNKGYEGGLIVTRMPGEKIIIYDPQGNEVVSFTYIQRSGGDQIRVSVMGDKNYKILRGEISENSAGSLEKRSVAV